MEIQVKEEARDDGVNASVKRIVMGDETIIAPNRFLTSPELGAKKRIKLDEPADSELMVQAKLMYPDTLTKIIREEEFFKRFVKQISSRSYGENGAAILYLSYRGSAEIDQARHLRTILDAQYLADLDFITLQQLKGDSAEDFLNSLNYAERWATERGVSSPIIPVIAPQKDSESASMLLNTLVEKGYTAVGLDLMGTFPYHTLRAVEEVQKRKVLWVHAFQAPPKIRIGREMSNCALGMVLHLFGVDSFSRWIVPPPPEPLTMDKINVFDRVGWGYLKRMELIDIREGEMGCNCIVCGGRDVKYLFRVKVLEALSKWKLHDHYSQRSELGTARERIRLGDLSEYLRSKEFPSNTLPRFGKLVH
jgi:hypothetical protein